MSRPNLGNLSIGVIYRPIRPLASASTLTNQEIPRKCFLRRHALRWGTLQLPLAPALSAQAGRGRAWGTTGAQLSEIWFLRRSRVPSPRVTGRGTGGGAKISGRSRSESYGSTSRRLAVGRVGRLGEAGGRPDPCPP